MKNSLLLIIQNYILQAKLKPLFSTKTFLLKHSLLLQIKDINHTIIPSTPFIDMITPYQTHHNCITFKINSIKLVFLFLEKSKTKNFNLIKACSIHTYHINALIHGKQFHLHDFENHVSFVV